MGAGSVMETLMMLWSEKSAGVFVIQNEPLEPLEQKHFGALSKSFFHHLCFYLTYHVINRSHP